MKKIQIKRFKNIENLDIELEDINLLIGANNSGKSSILQAIHFGIACGQTLKKYSPRSEATTVTYDELFYRPINNVKMLGFKGTLGRSENEKQIEIEYVSLKNKKASIKIETGKARGNSVGLRLEEHNCFTEILFDSSNSYSHYVTGLAGILSSEEYKSPALVKEAAVKGSSNNVFRNIVYMLSKKKREYSLFKYYLKQLFSDLDLIIEFNEDEDKEIHVYIKKNEGEKYPIDSFGTSLLQVVQMISYIYLFNPSIIILDEPDAHLHPDNQIKIINLLTNICKSQGIQIIVSTHSKYLLDYLIDKSNLLWVNDGKLVDYNKEQKPYIKILSDIGALNEGAKLSGKIIKVLVCTEDEDTTGIKTLLKSSGFNMNEVSVWSYKGCSQLNIAKIISEFMKDKYETLEIIVHRDRDFIYEEEQSQAKEEFLSKGLTLFFTKTSDVEGYFIEKEHIKSLYPDLELAQIENIINSSVKELEEKTKELLVNSRCAYEGRSANQGKIASKMYKAYCENPLNMTKGKDLLRRVCGKLQNLTKENANLVVESDYLKDDFLVEISTRV